MPRRSRMYLPGYTYHIFQRGNNRKACFFEEENYHVYLNYIGDSLRRYGVYLHAYCLMTNHVHLLITPSETGSISNLMKVASSRYAHYVNKKYSRTGSLWEGRHKSSAVESEKYLLKCSRYIELNPVAAKMVDSPGHYVWTSYHRNAFGIYDQLITPHTVYLGLGKSAGERCSNYRELFHQALSEKDKVAIREALYYSMPFGSDEFRDQIECRIGRPVGHARRGRPASNLIKNKSLHPL